MFDNKISKKAHLRDIISYSLVNSDFELSLSRAAEKIVSYYPVAKLWFSQTLNKRESFIAGAGEELYLAPEKIKLNEQYSLFIESEATLSEVEKEEIVNLSRLIIGLYDTDINLEISYGHVISF